MNSSNDITKSLCCIGCGGGLKYLKNSFVCVKCEKKYLYKDGIFDCMSECVDEKLFSNKKWNEFYKKWFENTSCIEEFNATKDNSQIYINNQLKKYAKVNKNTVYLELGCGSFHTGVLLANECKLVIGIDFSMPVLMVAKKILNSKGIKNYILIHGDIFKIPLKDSTVDFVYGAGVIEHFKDTLNCVKEYSRITKKGGVAINAVPYLNIGSLTYRQIWGNIPDFPVIKNIAEFIHIKLLKGKHMYFGYELSFTRRKLNRLHKLFGFSKIKFMRLDTEVKLDFLPNFIRPMLRKLAENCSWFWPMVVVVAEK